MEKRLLEEYEARIAEEKRDRSRRVRENTERLYSGRSRERNEGVMEFTRALSGES